MLRSLIVTISAFLLNINVAAQADKKKYSIIGEVHGIDSGTIRMMSRNFTKATDSAIIKDGKFEMHGKIGLAERRVFSISPGTWLLPAYIEDTLITLIADTTGAQHSGSSKDRVSVLISVEQRGGELAYIYKKYENETDFKVSLEYFYMLKNEFAGLGDNTTKKTETQLKIDSVANAILSRQKEWIEKYIDSAPSSLAGLYIFNELWGNLPSKEITYLELILDKFSPNLHASAYYQDLTKELSGLKNRTEKAIAPDFTLLQNNKAPFKLSSLRGSYILLDFWASWCAPCRKAIPDWQKVFAKYKNKSFTIVGVSTDRDDGDWIKALKKEKMPWIQIIDEFPIENEPSRVGSLYGTPSLPFYVLIDKEGKIVFSTQDHHKMIKKIEETIL